MSNPLANPKYTITEVAPKIYHIQFDNRVDTALHFLRYSEYFESVSESFFRRPFFLMDYIAWYAKNNGGDFSYANDWSGFNVPGFVFEKFFRGFFQGELQLDINSFDRRMMEIINKIRTTYNLRSYDWNFYLVGTSKSSKEDEFEDKEEDVLDHEVAHGLFATNFQYRSDMMKLIEELPTKFVKQFKKQLFKFGYNNDVHSDEIQAYLSTGANPDWLDYEKFGTEQEFSDKRPAFIETFRKHKNESTTTSSNTSESQN